MKTGKAIVASKVGFHARPATMFAREAKTFESDVRVRFGEKDIDGKSILSVLALGAKCGAEVEITTEGRDENDALVALVALVESDIE